MTVGPLHLGQPWWLLGLVLVPVVVVLGRRLARTLGRRRGTTVTVLRALAVTLLVLALAEPAWLRGGRGVDVVFLVDGSDSMGAVQDEASDWIAAALETPSAGDRAALARFGRDAQPEYPLRADPPPVEFDTVIAGEGTDIARGLRLAQGLAGAHQHRRVVLLSDGRATEGDATRTAAGLAGSGVAVDVVELGAATAADVLVESVAAPGRVRAGTAHDVVATLRNTGSAPADVSVVLRRDGEEVERRELRLEPGVTDEVFAGLEVTEDQVGDPIRWEVEVADPSDTVTANNVGRAGVLVDGPPQVLVVEGQPGAAEALAGALEQAGVRNEVVVAQQVPDLDRMLANDAVVLVDVPAGALDETALRDLDTVVRDAGRGLVLVGGDQSFGAGRWQDTPLEELSPVFADAQDPRTRPRVAEALVVDVSGSMAACHCRPAGFAGGPDVMEEGGIDKTDISKAAVSRAVEALSSQDTVGVLAFNDSSEWVLPLQRVPNADVVDEAVARLHPDGATNVVPALRTAIDGLRDVNAELRHIVLFTDGFSEEPAMIEVAQDALDVGITLSVVGTGEGTGDILERMAEAGGGRFYPGRDLSSIPEILVDEVRQVARPYIQEGQFLPVRTGPDPVADRLDETPELLGYVATTAKPTATTALRVGDQNDPLLARWQVGLGTSVAWTSDARATWAAPWVAWEGYGAFFTDLVTSTFPASGDGNATVTATAGTDGIEVTVAADAPLADGVTATATVVAPDGTRERVDLTRVSPTEWEGTAPGGTEGVTSVAVTLRSGEEVVATVSTTAIRSYSAEYLPVTDDAGQLAAIARAGGGRLGPDPSTAFERAGLAPGSGSWPLAWPLLLLALLTIPADVGVRRLRIRRSDFRRRRGPVEQGATAAGRLRERLRPDRGPAPDRDGAPDLAGGPAAGPAPPGPDATGTPPPQSPEQPAAAAPGGPPRSPAPTREPAEPAAEAPPPAADPEEPDGRSAARRLLDRRRD